MNVKNALKHLSEHPVRLILINTKTITYVALTGLLLLSSTVWSWPKAPSVPDVEQISQAVSTTNGV